MQFMTVRDNLLTWSTTCCMIKAAYRSLRESCLAFVTIEANNCFVETLRTHSRLLLMLTLTVVDQNLDAGI